MTKRARGVPLPEKIVFEDYQKMIYRSVWKIHKRTSWDWDDLYSEACLVFCQSVDRYEPGRGSFSTWLHHNLNQYLFNYVVRGFKSKEVYVEELPEKIDSTLFQTVAFKQAIERLSESAQHVVSLVLDTPEELVDICREQLSRWDRLAMCKENLFKYLRNHEGWSLYKCWQVSAEIRDALGPI